MRQFVTLMAFMLLSPMVNAQSYSSLWKAEQAYENDGRPQSAYDVTQQILRKAEAEHNQGQALSARLRAAALHQEWAPDSFFTDVAELEKLRLAETQPVSKAIYASILAEVYENNRHRSQARRLQLTSDDMREWTMEQYDSAARANWELSLTDIDVLMAARSKDWLPFIEQNRSSDYFQCDLLHILWQRYRDQQVSVWSEDGARVKARGHEIAECYRSAGNRNASLLVELDVCDAPESLLDSYSDLPLCVEVYLHMLQMDTTEMQKVAWAEEALRRYPRYERINAVRNMLNNLLTPRVEWVGNGVCYPAKQYAWALRGKNATGMTIEVLKLPDSFSQSQLNNQREPVAYLRRIGQRIETITHQFAGAPSTAAGQTQSRIVTVTDTIQWTAPDLGHYALLFAASTGEREANKSQLQGQYSLLDVSRLQYVYRCYRQQMEVIVVDSETGHPAAGATVSLYRDNDSGNTTLVSTARVDSGGRTVMTLADNSYHSYYLHAHTDGDIFVPKQHLWGRGNSGQSRESANTVLRLYTDRAIYRPGQTLHLGGIVYEQKHWDARVQAGLEYELVMRDANGKEAARQTVQTDEMGVIAADFILPVGRLPGVYSIVAGSSRVTFRVEEYKRPTFEVKLDEAPALQWPQDSIVLTGKAVGYNGVPVRSARVTGSYRFAYPRYWWEYYDDSPIMRLDTVMTDDGGRFSVAVPLAQLDDETLRRGLDLKLDVDVLNAAGETRQATSHTPLCTTPLRLLLSMTEMQDRERLSAPQFQLLSSTGRPTAGTVNWQIVPVDGASSSGASGTIVYTQDGRAAQDIDLLLSALSAMPSGEYELQAVASAGADTASTKQRFVLFSFDDVLPASHQELWLYCPSDTFSTGYNAILQVGTSHTDAIIYWSLVANSQVRQQGMLQLSNQLSHLDIPYDSTMGDGATVHLVLVKDGSVITKSQTLRHAMPDTELRWQWTSFRDRVHPGDTETWTLRITRPDGTPAPANLMATVYDATLDALTPHLWQLLVSRGYNITSTPWRFSSYYTDTAHELYYFPMRSYQVPELSFDAFNPQYFTGLGFSHYAVYSTMRLRGTRPMLKASRANGTATVEEMAVADAAPMAMAAVAPQMVADGAEYETAEEAAAEDSDAGEAVGDAAAAVRTNFNETAYFAPRLRTDAEGNVTLQFTLPQSLTTWHMMGVAHTADLNTANIEAQTVARKELMAHLYMPRFLRVGDNGTITASIQNLTDQALSGKARLEIYDPEASRVLSKQQATFSTESNGEATLMFAYTPDEQPTILAVRFTAETREFSDGEQYLLPVLSDKTYVTESVEIQADGKGVFTTDLTSLFANNAASATNRMLTVEYTTHPIWTVVQSLPALREPQNDDVLSLTCAFYANTLASHIVATTPRLRDVLELWQAQCQQGRPQGLNSPLEEDAELKQMVLDETPWLRDAMSDTERMSELCTLFDANLLESNLGGTLTRLQERQQSDGGFSWFPGMRSSELMTRLVAIYLTQLRSLTAGFSSLSDDSRQMVNNVLQHAVAFVARENSKMVQDMKRAEARGETVRTGNLIHLHYIYIAQRSGIRLTSAQQSDVRYLLDHLRGTVASMDNQERALAAVVLKGAGRSDWRDYYTSLQEHLTVTTNHGSFFDYAGGSFTPASHKIIAHTVAVEAVRDVDADNATLLSGLRRWLLQQKRTQMWESNICTVNAIYALLHDNNAQLSSTLADGLSLRYGKRTVNVQSSAPSAAALGYVKASYTDGQMPQSITVRRNNEGEAWGAVYASYLIPYADAVGTTTGLSVRREVSSINPRLGDRITTRYIITADRDYEYVCLRADRAACAEPQQQISGYYYQGGLGYYMAMHDAHTDYFFDRLPKGTYVLEEASFIDRDGQYTTGLARIQCLYAPEFGGHTNTYNITITK